jgi:Mg2+/citrate symporter
MWTIESLDRLVRRIVELVKADPYLVCLSTAVANPIPVVANASEE